MPHTRLQRWPQGRSAEAHDEARLTALCAPVAHATHTLDAADCAALASLPQRADHLRCLLTSPCTEEPTFTRDGILPPLYALIAATPLVEVQDAASHAPLTARAWATATLELAALLGGDQRLSVLGLVMSEVEGAGEEFDPVYAQALAQRACAEADAGPEPELTRKQALELLAIIAWLRGEPAQEHAGALAARVARGAKTSLNELVALASFGCWDVVAPHLRDAARRDKLKRTADGLDLKEAAWAEHELAALDALATISTAPDSLDDATQRAIRARLKGEQGWDWSRPMIHWLRLLWWREGGALGPYDVLARVFDELPLHGDEGSYRVTPRTRPAGYRQRVVEG